MINKNIKFQFIKYIEKYMIKSKEYYLFRYLFLIGIHFNGINPLDENSIRLKIGLKNQKVFLPDNNNPAIYEIKTNYLHLKLLINNFNNIKTSQISDKILSQTISVNKCSYSSNFCQSK